MTKGVISALAAGGAVLLATLGGVQAQERLIIEQNLERAETMRRLNEVKPQQRDETAGRAGRTVAPRDGMKFMMAPAVPAPAAPKAAPSNRMPSD